MTRAEAEQLLDSIGAAERPLPSPAAPRRGLVAKDW
jgi:hypothetical protein